MCPCHTLIQNHVGTSMLCPCHTLDCVTQSERLPAAPNAADVHLRQKQPWLHTLFAVSNINIHCIHSMIYIFDALTKSVYHSSVCSKPSFILTA